uniref:DUF4145 domain-containing protein n=1 Tax=Panagrellus redivivus TaxID=6233 RepID=A0A7E4VUH4_PANRE
PDHVAAFLADAELSHIYQTIVKAYAAIMGLMHVIPVKVDQNAPSSSTTPAASAAAASISPAKTSFVLNAIKDHMIELGNVPVHGRRHAEKGHAAIFTVPDATVRILSNAKSAFGSGFSITTLRDTPEAAFAYIFTPHFPITNHSDAVLLARITLVTILLIDLTYHASAPNRSSSILTRAQLWLCTLLTLIDLERNPTSLPQPRHVVA